MAACPPTGAWPLAPPETIVVEGRTGEHGPGAGRGRRADPAEPRLGRRGRGARPAARRARPRPLRRARDQDRPDRRPDGRPRRGDLGRARRRRGPAEVAEPGAPPRPAQRHRDRGRRRRGRDGPRLRPGPASTRPARTSARSPRAPTPAGASRRATIERLVEVQGRILRRGASRRCARAARSSTRPARSPAARTRSRSRPCSRERRRRAAALSVDDLGARAGLASPIDPRCLQLRPDRDRTTGFFICRLKRDDERWLTGTASVLKRASARAAASPGCARRSCPGRFRCVYCLRRFELVSQCPNCGEHQTIARMSTTEDMTCQTCGDSMLRPV